MLAGDFSFLRYSFYTIKFKYITITGISWLVLSGHLGSHYLFLSGFLQVGQFLVISVQILTQRLPGMWWARIKRLLGGWATS